MEPELVKEATNTWNFIPIGIGVLSAFLYCRWFINYCLKNNKGAPTSVFHFIGWFNAIVGVFFHLKASMCFGICVLFYRYVIIPLKFEKQ